MAAVEINRSLHLFIGTWISNLWQNGQNLYCYIQRFSLRLLTLHDVLIVSIWEFGEL